jgi:hypothetical protein
VTLRTALAISFGIAGFLVVSFLVARWLTAENRERDAIVDVLRAQAAGDAPAMVAAIDGCADDAACRAAVQARARALARPGTVKILDYRSGTSYTLGSAEGVTRVAWNTSSDDRPVVQCVDVRRSGLPFLGGTISVEAVGPRIPGEASCPA